MSAFITETGPMFYVLALALLLLLPLAIVSAVGARWVGLHGAGLSSVAMSLSIGSLGTTYGLVQGFSAIVTAPPDMKGALMAVAIEMALNSMWIGLVGAALIAPPHLVGWVLRPSARGNWFWTAGVFLGSGALLLAVVGGVVLVVSVQMVGGIPSSPASPTEAVDAAQRISVLLGVGAITQGAGALAGLLGALACLTLGPIGWWWSRRLDEAREAPGSED